jgi:hypothetical protein
MVWDAATDQLVGFGGHGDEGGYHDDAWSIPMAGGAFWAPIVTLGAAPGPRTAAALIVDPVRHRLLLFGGLVGPGPGGANAVSSDLWQLPLDGPPAWSPVPFSGTPPSARLGHAAVYDPARDRMIVFGGDTGGQSASADAWALTLSGTPTWSALAACPAAQLHPEAVYDPVRDRIVVLSDRHFGGTNDVWALSLGSDAWSMLPAGANPPMPGRDLASVVYDPDGDRLLVYGGFDSGTYSDRSDLWAYALNGASGWTQLTLPGDSPGPRENTPGVYDAARHRMVVAWGGADRQAWALPLAPMTSWTRVTLDDPVRPAPRFLHQAVYDAPRHRMVLSGGVTSPMSDDLWALSLDGTPAFTRLTATNSPGYVYRPVTALDDARERMVLLPGDSRGAVWVLALATSAWTQIVPSPLTSHDWAYAVGTYDPLRDRLIVFGGSDSPCPYPICAPVFDRETWALSFSGTPTWSKLDTQGDTPPELLDATAIYDPLRDRMIVYGGDAQTSPYGTNGRTWALSLSGVPTWSVVAEPTSPELNRSRHTATYDPVRDRMVVYGGYLGSQSQAWALKLAGTPTWQRLASIAPPSLPPYDHTAIYDPVGDRMIVSEGYNGNALITHWALTWGEPVTAVPGGDPKPSLSLRARSNPALGPIEVEFTLAGTADAYVELMDVSGRVLESRRLAQTDATRGRAALSPRSPLRPGVYFVRLEQGARRASTRVAVLR